MSRNLYEVEDCRILSISVLKPNLKQGYGSGNYRWLVHNQVDSQIGYNLSMRGNESGNLRLNYTITSKFNGEKKDLSYPIRVSSSNTNIKGLRYWIHCPLSKNGISCDARVSKLYLSPNCDYFGCRKCLQLTYHSKSFNYRNGILSAMNKVFNLSDLEEKIKRYTYAGKPTRKMRKINEQRSRYAPFLNKVSEQFN